MKIIGIYKITSPSEKAYVGQSWNIQQRWVRYRCPGGARSQPKLANSLTKYGSSNHRFEILLELPSTATQSELDRWEQFYLDEFRAAGIEMLNIREGGSTGRLAPETIEKMVATRRANGSYIVTEATRKKQSMQRAGRPGTPHTPETKEKLSQLRTGTIQSQEAREKNRRSQLGRKHPESVKEKIGAANRGNKRPDLSEFNRRCKAGVPGHPHSEATKEKIGLAQKGRVYAKGRVQSPEERQNRSVAIKQWWATRREVAPL